MQTKRPSWCLLSRFTSLTYPAQVILLTLGHDLIVPPAQWPTHPLNFSRIQATGHSFCTGCKRSFLNEAGRGSLNSMILYEDLSLLLQVEPRAITLIWARVFDNFFSCLVPKPFEFPYSLVNPHTAQHTH